MEKLVSEGSIRSGADAYVTNKFSIRVLVAHVCSLIESGAIVWKFSMNQLCASAVIFPDRIPPLGPVGCHLEQDLAQPRFSLMIWMMKLGDEHYSSKPRGVTGYSLMNIYVLCTWRKQPSCLLSEKYRLPSPKVLSFDPFYFSKYFKAQWMLRAVYQRGVVMSWSLILRID